MAIGTPVEIGSNTSLSGSSISIAVPAGGVPAGASILVAFGNGDGGESGYSVADDASNSYTIDVIDSQPGGVFRTCFLASAHDVSALDEGETITISFGGTEFRNTAIAAYVTGLETSSVLDQSNSDTGASTTPSSGDITTTQADEIIFGVLNIKNADASEITDDGDYNTIDEIDSGGSTNNTLHLAYRIVSSTETNNFAPTIANSDNWIAIVASYKGAAAAAAADGPVPGSLGLTGVGI